MNWFDALGDDAKKAVAGLIYLSKVDFEKAVDAVKERVVAALPPAPVPTAPTQAQVEKVSADAKIVLKDGAAVARLVGIFFPPAAVVSSDLTVAADLTPLVAQGFAMLSLLSGGKIPQVTLDLEQTIDMRFGTDDAPEAQS